MAVALLKPAAALNPDSPRDIPGHVSVPSTEKTVWFSANDTKMNISTVHNITTKPAQRAI